MSQWPRWEVFKQDTARKPHQAVGSVHATDADHALLNARHLFARRPQAISMWVARTQDIYEVTEEQLTNLPPPPTPPSDEAQTYAVFLKSNHRRSMTYVDYVGEVMAHNAQEALTKAQQTLTTGPALAWWVVRSADITPSAEADSTSWFEPAKTKTYKQQSAYGTIGSHPRKHPKAPTL